VPRPVIDEADDELRPSANLPVPPVLPLETTPGHLIRRAQQVHTALWSTELNGDLTGPQYALLSALSSSGGLDQRSAGRMVSLDKSTTADVVARLERNGWIRRDRDPADGRRNTLALTRAARAALVDVTARVQIVQERLLGPLEPDSRDRFVDLLGRVAYAGTPSGDQRIDAPVLPLSTTPGHLVRRAEQVHGTLWVTHVGDGVTPAQYALMCVLAQTPDLDQTAAGELASLDKSSAADVVARLVRRDWIASTRDPADRRRKVLALSPGAVALLDEVTPAVRVVQRAFLEPLAPDEQGELTEMLRRVAYHRQVPG
jgi:MarR family transcriptional regulator, lower aerobic nicotinate degradation pathway regulator